MSNIGHMFDEQVVSQVDAGVAALAELDLSTLSLEQAEHLIRSTQSWVETLQGAHARVVDEFESQGGPQLAGCSTMSAWLRRELRLSPAQTRRRRRAGAALRQLPDVAAALAAGSIRMDHVDVFADATRRIGTPAVRDAEHILLGVAVAGDPRDLRIACDHLRDAVDPGAAERDWVHAQEKQDINCHRVGSGYQVNGWLSPETGAKLRALLDSFGKPANADDDRPVAQRRVEGLDALLDAVLAGGLPSDHGVRPHLVVTVDATTLAYATSGDRTSPSPPATLAGYGSIGRDLLARLACDAALTTVLTDAETTGHRPPSPGPGCTNGSGGGGGDPGPGPGHDPPGPRHACGCALTPYRHVLDVGRTERIATAKQRLAVLVAQGFRCATPGCNNTHLQIHHIVPWLLGGRTDMHNLIGLCTSCHTLLHQGHLVCTADGHGGAVFYTADGTPIPDTRRRTMSQYERGLDAHSRRSDTGSGSDAA